MISLSVSSTQSFNTVFSDTGNSEKTTVSAQATKAAASASVDTSAVGAVQVSDQAIVLSDLMSDANKFVVSEHLEPFTGFQNGSDNDNGYIDVKKYNDYVFDKAASDVVDSAKKSGINLDKKQVIDQLKSRNSDIAGLQTDKADRIKNLGPGSVWAELSDSEMSKLTYMYITAKESGIPTTQIGVVAMSMGIIDQDKRLGVTLTVYDPAKEAAATSGNVSQTSATPGGEKNADLVAKLVAKLSLSPSVANYLVELDRVRVSVGKGTDPQLDFLKAILSANPT